jgi:hypothetical protein
MLELFFILFSHTQIETNIQFAFRIPHDLPNEPRPSFTFPLRWSFLGSRHTALGGVTLKIRVFTESEPLTSEQHRSNNYWLFQDDKDVFITNEMPYLHRHAA